MAPVVGMYRGTQLGPKGIRYFDPNLPKRTRRGSIHACGRAFEWVSGQPGVASAKQYIGQLRRDSHYREVPSGQALRVDDVVVYQAYGRRGAGAVHGHVGVVGMQNDEPMLVSLMNGARDIRRITGKPTFFRRVK